MSRLAAPPRLTSLTMAKKTISWPLAPAPESKDH